MKKRRKGERIADMYLENPDIEKTVEDLYSHLYGERRKKLNYKEVAKLSSHLTVARKLLREQGIFLADPRTNDGRYKVENNLTQLEKKGHTGSVRMENGFEDLQLICKKLVAELEGDPESIDRIAGLLDKGVKIFPLITKFVEVYSGVLTLNRGSEQPQFPKL